MAGRGRGRGANHSFNREINERLGLSGVPGEGHSDAAVLEPPALFPPMENPPVPLDLGVEGEYLLALKRDFVEHFRDSPAFLQHTVIKSDFQRYGDRYQTATLASRSVSEIVCDWSYFPSELRENSTKTLRKKRKLQTLKRPAKILKKAEDITNRLEELEKREEEDVEGEVADLPGDSERTKEKDAESDVEDEVEDEDLDEEMDDGTDYINNYFDNGEDYIDDEDDNLDDGPIY